MKPPQPLPQKAPFVSFYTPTFRRPRHLAVCLASVSAQTAASDVEQIVVPDHVGYGVAHGLYGRLKWYASALRGKYINLLCDDDALASDDVVATVLTFALRHRDPDVIVTRVKKGDKTFPASDPTGPPVLGDVDLTSYLVRSDVWRAHLNDYGLRYEGDFDHLVALKQAGRAFAFCNVLWAIGGASNGRPEA